MFKYNLNLAMQKLPLDTKKLINFLLFCIIALIIVILRCLETPLIPCIWHILFCNITCLYIYKLEFLVYSSFFWKMSRLIDWLLCRLALWSKYSAFLSPAFLCMFAFCSFCWDNIFHIYFLISVHNIGSSVTA